jgi:hypothetical protein
MDANGIGEQLYIRREATSTFIIGLLKMVVKKKKLPKKKKKKKKKKNIVICSKIQAMVMKPMIKEYLRTTIEMMTRMTTII